MIRAVGWSVYGSAALSLALALVSCSTSNKTGQVPEYGYGGAGPDFPGEQEGAPAAPGVENNVPAESPSDGQWPREFVGGGATNIVYQPQVETWDGHTLVAHNAVAIQAPDRPQPVYGVITVQATTVVDKTRRSADLENVQILKAEFPSAPDKEKEYLALLRAEFPKQFQAVSLDRLTASLAATQEEKKAAAQPLNNTPPTIVFATRPSILVYVDGPPTLRPIGGATNLQQVINTRVLLLKDGPGGRFYLHVLDGYLSAPDLNGPWTVAAAPPGATAAESQARASRNVDLLQGQPDPNTQAMPALTQASAPQVFVSTKPAELITFDGQPDFVTISGTHLLYVTNTTANVFKLLTDQQTYVLISGRWYRAPSLQGPWQYVPGEKLPSDFAQIPDSSPKENVKASVPGTPQAREALIENSIPQSAKVARTTEITPIHIDGPMQLVPIQGTSLYYVFNSDTPLIKANDQAWFACQNGVWFSAPSSSGPWTVADAVPNAIYSIPPSSPLYYVTNVRIYGSTVDYVYEGYTPGYFGTVVAPDDTVVYGTGYDYEPWVGSVWYGPPITYGLGCDLAWTPWFGWDFGFGFGWFWGVPHRHFYGLHPPAPWWGPYHHWAYRSWGRMNAWGPGGWAHAGVNVYDRHLAPAGAVGRSFGANRWSGVYGAAYNSRTGRLAAGHGAEVSDVFHSAARGPLTPTGRVEAARPNDAFAMPGGRVYFRDSHEAAGWRGVTPSTDGTMSRSALFGLSRESAARDMGQQRFESFRGTVPAGGFHSSSGFHGGGMGGGGHFGGGGVGHGGGGGGGHR